VKVTIVGGAGGVGASVAFNLLRSGRGFELALVDRRAEMVISHAMDLEQVLEQGSNGAVRPGDEADIAAADVVVVTAAAPLTVNTSRMVYLDDNARILGAVLELLPPAWGGVLLVVTNPVDPLCTWALQSTELDRRRVLGYTLNDSLRLRTAIGRELGVAPGLVDAWAIGEHGDLSVALFDRVRVDGADVALSASQQANALEFLRGWYARHVALDSGRSSTWTSGLGVARMVCAVQSDAGELWPASVALRGEYGVDGVCLSVPVRLGRHGTREIVQWSLTRAEQDALHSAADFVREASESIGASAR
jgi:malate/lactate dehydrogenase